jgi:hypothetical protein
MYFAPSFPFDFGCCLVGPLICKLAGTSSENSQKQSILVPNFVLQLLFVLQGYISSLTAVVSFLKQISPSEI